MTKPVDYPAVLAARFATSSWAMIGNDYDALEWNSDSPKPSRAELDALWPEVQAEIEAEAQARIMARETALAKLVALGLSEAEIRALVG